MKRHIIRWLRPSTEDLKALLVERLPSPRVDNSLSFNALNVQDALLRLHHAHTAHAHPSAK